MKRSCGFTLVELLLATTLLAILTALLFSILSVSGRFWSRMEARIEPLVGYWTLERFLQTTLRRAKVWTVEGETFPLEGEEERIAFTATLPYALVFKGPLRFELYREGETLRVKVHPLPRGEAYGTVLLEKVRKVRFRYFGWDPLNPGKGRWETSWREKPLPLLVEITIEATPPWPPIVVALPPSQALGAAYGSGGRDFFRPSGKRRLLEPR